MLLPGDRLCLGWKGEGMWMCMYVYIPTDHIRTVVYKGNRVSKSRNDIRGV